VLGVAGLFTVVLYCVNNECCHCCGVGLTQAVNAALLDAHQLVITTFGNSTICDHEFRSRRERSHVTPHPPVNKNAESQTDQIEAIQRRALRIIFSFTNEMSYTMAYTVQISISPV